MTAKSVMKFFLMVLLVMVGIFVIKKVTATVNIPVVSGMAQAV